MRRLHAALLIALCASPAQAQTEHIYTVHQSISRPDQLQLTLELSDADAGAPRQLAARGTAWGLTEQIQSPICDGTHALRKEADGHWLVPVGCHRVTWTVRTPTMPDGSVDLSAQASVSMAKGGWSLLSEPTSLLRVVGDKQTAGRLRAADANTRLLGATLVGPRAWRVPADNNAPEFFVLGAPHSVQRRIGNFTVRYIADYWPRVHHLGLTKVHARALNYLGKVVYGTEPVPQSDRDLLVVWVGIDAQHGLAGGAAGSRSFLANYLIGDGRDATDHAAATLMILSHEQFHQLADARRGALPSLPAWVNESIAQYYGLRAMQRALGDNAAARQLTQRFIAPDATVPQSLIQAEKLFATERPRALELAYRQGATFWHGVDGALRQASQGAVSLDTYVPGLLQMRFPEDGALPAELLDQWRHWDRDGRIDARVRRYVGTADASKDSGG